MTKKDLIRMVAERLSIPQIEAGKYVEAVFGSMVDALIDDKRVDLRDVGIFEVKIRKARMARNPHTNTMMPVKAKYAVTFKAGKQLLQTVTERLGEPT